MGCRADERVTTIKKIEIFELSRSSSIDDKCNITIDVIAMNRCPAGIKLTEVNRKRIASCSRDLFGDQ